MNIDVQTSKSITIKIINVYRCFIGVLLVDEMKLAETVSYN